MKKIITCLLMCVLLTITAFGAFAEISPTAPVKYKVTVSHEGNGDAKREPGTISYGDKIVFEAIEDDEFIGWTITGDYEIIEGTLESKRLVIRGFSDIHGHAVFASIGDATTPAPTQGNTSPSSPKTGTNSTVFVFVGIIALAGVSIAAVNAKKKEN